MARLHKMRCSSSSADGDGSFRSLSFCRLCAFASACYYAPISRSLSPDPEWRGRVSRRTIPLKRRRKEKEKGGLQEYKKRANPCTLHFIHVLSDLFFLSLLPFCRPPEVVTCSDSGTFPIDTNCPQESLDNFVPTATVTRHIAMPPHASALTRCAGRRAQGAGGGLRGSSPRPTRQVECMKESFVCLRKSIPTYLLTPNPPLATHLPSFNKRLVTLLITVFSFGLKPCQVVQP